MKWKITERQIEALIAGQPLSIGRRRIYANDYLKDLLDQVLKKEINAVAILNGNTIDIIDRKTKKSILKGEENER